MRTFVARQDWQYKDLRYTTFYQDQVVPQPHTSGCWSHGFEFNNDYFLLLGIL